MKKLLLSAFLGLATLALTPALSQAGTFGLFTGCGCFGCCSKCNFCVRPYNAFTPVCSGNITCMGCMPFASPSPNYSGMGYGGPACGGSDYGATGSCGGEIIGQTQMLPPLPATNAPQFAQPAPLTAPVQQPTTIIPPGPSSMVPNPYGTIQAGYRPAYAPTYNPYSYYGYYGATGAAPYYWNAK